MCTSQRDLPGFKKSDLKQYEKADDLMVRGETAEALAIYKKLERRYPSSHELLVQMATAFLDLGQTDRATDYLKRLAAMNYREQPLVYATLGKLYRSQKKYDDAIKSYSVFLELSVDKPVVYQKTLLIIKELEFIMSTLKAPDDILLQPLPHPINTSHSEYLPQFSIDGRSLVFTRRVRNQEDIYEVVGPETEPAIRAIDVINTPFNEGAHTLSSDGKVLIFTHCNDKIGYGSCDLYQSEKSGSGWSVPRNLGGRINSRSWDSQPSLSADGQQLFFVSNRKGSIGSKDIWVSIKKDGQWSSPVNLRSLNTTGNEESPFIHADNETLFFRSDQLLGLGGFDIYRSKKTGGRWGEPAHLGSPINTTGNDGALVVSLDGTRGYLATDTYRGADLGNLDIMEFELPARYRPLPMTFLKGRITNEVSKMPIQASIEVVDLSTRKLMVKTNCDLNGEFLIAIPVKERLLINVSLDGFLFHSDHLHYDSVRHQVAPFIKNIELIPVPMEKTETSTEAKPVVLNNVFFESGKSELLPESMVEIQYLFSLMRELPGSSIHITGHTDNVGMDEDNLLLSQRRAEAVRAALIGLGIAESRISAEGKGESAPIADNDTPEGRAANRRTTFQLLR